MNEQLIAQLQLLIELAKTGEEFECVFYGDSNVITKHKIDCNDILTYLDSYKGWGFNYLNEFEIIRKPWKPKEGEPYWYWYPYGGKIEDIAPYKVDSFWSKSMHDLPNYMIGNCFRTKEECESHTEIRDKLIAMRKEYE